MYKRYSETETETPCFEFTPVLNLPPVLQLTPVSHSNELPPPFRNRKWKCVYKAVRFYYYLPTFYSANFGRIFRFGESTVIYVHQCKFMYPVPLLTHSKASTNANNCTSWA